MESGSFTFEAAKVRYCPQETHLRTNEIKLLYHVSRGEIYHASSGSRSAGIMIGISFGTDWQLSQKILDLGGKFLILKGSLSNRNITLIGVYALNQNQMLFGRTLLGELLECDSMELIAFGDFNAVVDKDWDCSQQFVTILTLPVGFEEFRSELDLIDIWQRLNPLIRDYSFFSYHHQSYS